MDNKGIMIINHNVPCACACRYCFFRSCKKANAGIPYYRGKKIALCFNEWRKEKKLNDFWLCYAISHCADYPELIDNIVLNKSFGFSGIRYLQINGLKFKNQSELTEYLINAKNAGIISIDTTFYGLEEYHDKFAARKGDFRYLLNILKIALEIGIIPKPTFVILEDNKDQIEDLISLLQKYIGVDGAIHGFLQDYRGNGENLENVRLTLQSYEAMSDKIKQYINISRYKTEEEWLNGNSFSQYTSRNLILALRPDNIDMLETMTCDEIINYLIDLDKRYYNVIPDIDVLAKFYGNKNCQKLYRQRDLLWKWQKQFIADNKLQLHDVTDERLCGSMRF